MNLYHFVLYQVADALSDSRADKVGGVTQEDGAARLAAVFIRLFSFTLLHWLKTLLYLWVWSH